MSIGVLQIDDATSIAFEVNADRIRTWQDMRRQAEARWHSHDVYQGKPRLEFLGPGLATLSFSVRLDIDRGVIPRDELRLLREQVTSGTVLQFTIGSDLVGDFVLKGMSESLDRFNREGVLTKATVNLTLEEFVS